MLRFITIDKDKIITSIRYGTAPIEGEILSEVGEIGQKLLADGTFIDIPQLEIPTVTMEDKINYIYYKLQGVIM